MIKVVLFDIDNTILSFDAQEESSLKKSFKHFNYIAKRYTFFLFST